MAYENKVKIVGTIVEELKYLDEKFEDIYVTTIDIKRYSGKVDSIPLKIPVRVLKDQKIAIGTRVELKGDIRSFTQNHKLEVSVFVKEISITEAAEDVNEVEITGNICKPQVLRKTSFNRIDICDLMIVYHRVYNKREKNDYIPALAWGRNAKEIAYMPIGVRVYAQGRLQSREYTKIIYDESITRTVIELSCSWVTT